MNDSPDPIQITRSGVTRGFGFSLVCSGYLVEDGKVLLVHHRGFDKWVPPGGHVEAGDTFDQTAVREFKEETGLDVEAISATATLLNDDNATPLPGPFYVDLEKEGFRFPSITQFYYVRRLAGGSELTPQLEEVHGLGWFGLEELDDLPTFEQVRVISRYAIENHPDVVSASIR